MKNLEEMAAEESLWESPSKLQRIVPEKGGQDGVHPKQIAIMERCDCLLEMLFGYEGTYEEILSALAVSHKKSLGKLREEIFTLKESVPRLERKRIKRIRLIGTLTDIQKTGQKMKLKPELARKKDLFKLDEFLLRSCRALASLNDKTRDK
jgi:hypothetical protein